MKKRQLILTALIIFAGLGLIQAANLGDPAPEIQIETWIKGKPVQIEKGNIYVVEFWATWCAPCRTTIPHLTELQEKFENRGVVFIGITSEAVSTVKPFVEKMGQKMDYHVAIDQDRKTSRGYMEAFGVRGIPHAFVVDKEGKIAWHGHPMSDLENILTRLTSGSYNMQDRKKMEAAENLMPVYFHLVSKTDEEDLAEEVGNRILKYAGDNPPFLDRMAWAIVSNPETRKEGLPFAEKAIEKAYQATEGENFSILDTYARIMESKGNYAKAVELGEKAVKLAEGEDVEGELKKRLEDYREKLEDKKK